MIPEKVFQQILALGEAWRVARMDYQEKEQRVLIRVEETPELWAQENCPHCAGKTVRGYDHAPERRWRHLNVCQLQSEIVCALPRGECQSCRKIYTVRAPWEGRSRGLTQEFEAFALTLMREMPVKKAGEILGETDQKLWRALFAHVDAAWQDLSWENVIWVGADEMNRKKGHNYPELSPWHKYSMKNIFNILSAGKISQWILAKIFPIPHGKTILAIGDHGIGHRCRKLYRDRGNAPVCLHQVKSPSPIFINCNFGGIKKNPSLHCFIGANIIFGKTSVKKMTAEVHLSGSKKISNNPIKLSSFGMPDIIPLTKENPAPHSPTDLRNTPNFPKKKL